MIKATKVDCWNGAVLGYTRFDNAGWMVEKLRGELLRIFWIYAASFIIDSWHTNIILFVVWLLQSVLFLQYLSHIPK